MVAPGAKRHWNKHRRSVAASQEGGGEGKVWRRLSKQSLAVHCTCDQFEKAAAAGALM